MENGRIGRAMFLVGKISFVLLVFLPAGIVEIVTKPTVTEVVVGGSTFFNCSTNGQLKINWFLTKVGSDAANYIYLNDTFRTGIGRFQMERDKSNGAYNLVITLVKMEDAGLYGCEEDGGQRSKHEAQLIVLDPVCEPHFDTHEIIGPNKCGIEPTQLIISCKVNYNGNEAPIMEWRKASDKKSVSEGVTRETIDNKRVVYNLTINGNPSVKDRKSYQCITTRSATVNYGCKTGNITVKGTASETYMYINIVCILVSLGLVIVSAVAGFKVGEHNMKKRGPTKNENKTQSDAPKGSECIELIDTQSKETIEKLIAENRSLLAKVNELEQQPYTSDNKVKITTARLAHTIKTKAGVKTPITGMAILDNNLFVIKKNYPVVEVYDSETFVFVRLIDKICFTNPLDIASSKEDKCLYLYVICQENSASRSQIFKFDTAGDGGKVWAIENDVGRLSIYESNLIVCFSTMRIIIEYTPEGQPVNTVRLSPANGFKNLLHAVKLTEAHFVVSHSKIDSGQRVCVVDISGSVLKAFEKLPDFHVNVITKDYLPIYLVGQRDEYVLVADARHRRVLLLSPKELEYEAELLETDKIQTPVRLCLNATKDRLFVGVDSIHSKSEELKEGLILIYNLTK